jgi:hypothetical protein
MPIVRTRLLLNRILTDEALTRNLGDEEARLLVEWLVEWAERIQACSPSFASANDRIERLRRRGRAIRQFIELWCYREEFGAAAQMAVVERFRWPLPSASTDPWELMHTILDHESETLAASLDEELSRLP